ncbi:MAG TPA: hypothetical protein VFL29_08815, partial [Candidatus Dormibacteraeota bacterium]|nr:hypothetical protein [Candidatus Dormibacteraeota bacterium]
RYDSAMFWLAFGTAAAVIGLALMTIGVTRSAAGADLFGSGWFDGGLGLLALGGLMLLWALGLYLARRRAGAQAEGGAKSGKEDVMAEAVRGYYAERDKLFKMYGKQEKTKRTKR